MFNRRQFIKASGALALFPLVQRVQPVFAAADADAHFFVLFRIFNGMDAVLGLDPWATLPDEKDMFLDYDPANPQERIPLSNNRFIGPAMAPMKDFAEAFSVINGIFMSQSDNGHTAAQTYISAGTASGTAPTLPVELAISTLIGDFGVLNNSTLEMGSRSALSSSMADLKQIDSDYNVTPLLEGLGTQANTPYSEAVRRVISSQPSVDLFVKTMKDISGGGEITDQHVMAAAFMTRMATCAQFDVNFNLDTHAQHKSNHKSEQTKAWQAFADLCTLFKKVPYGATGKSLFDSTTFLVVTEFSRTPALNAAAGKDHNPLTNSCLIGGKGVRPGVTVGASRLVTSAESPTGASYHIAYPIDYYSGDVEYQRTVNSRMIFPENVAKTVATIMNVDGNLFHSIPPDTMPLSKLFL